MLDLFTDKVKLLTAICVLLANVAGLFGWKFYEKDKEVWHTREQVTNIVNHFYGECHKPEGD